MKFFLLIILCTFVCNSCSSTDSYIKKFAREIIERPDRLDSLRILYPNFINDKFLSKEMEDTSILKNLKINLQKSFNNKSSCLSKSNLGIYSINELSKKNHLEKYSDKIVGICYEKDGFLFIVVYFTEGKEIFLVEVEMSFIRSKREKIILERNNLNLDE